MVRAFRIAIIAYLRDNDGATAQTDIKTRFLPELNTLEKRKAFKQALDILSYDNLIILNGSHDFLNWKLANSLYPLDDKIIEAKITTKGLSYQEPQIVEKTLAEPEAPLDMPLPPAVKAISDIFISKTRTEERLVAKMKKMGAAETHMDIKRRAGTARSKTKHVPAVHNPFEEEVDLGELDPLLKIIMQSDETEQPKRQVSAFLKWGMVIVCAALITLIVMVLKVKGRF